jgi:hypothetical protein
MVAAIAAAQFACSGGSAAAAEDQASSSATAIRPRCWPLFSASLMAGFRMLVISRIRNATIDP